MADTDGMLMNFSIGDDPLERKPKFTGGSWRDRLAAKKIARHRQLKAVKPRPQSKPSDTDDGTPAEVTNDVVAEDESSLGRPVKRQRVGAPAAGSTTERASRNKTPGQAVKQKDREVISSLFSFNPESTSVPDKDSQDAAPVDPSNAPLLDGLSTFITLGLSSTLSTHLLTKLALKAPTAIQKAAIPQLITDDSDAFVQAETGSGKTLAYLLPILQRIMEISKRQGEDAQVGDGKVHRDSGLFAIILAPTRELCKQISVVLDSLLCCAHWIVAGTVIGGEKKKSEKARLRKGLNILVATPGRLADHLDNTEVLDVGNVRWLVLDEGDRLMELGFEEEIQSIVKKISKRSRIPSLSRRTDQTLPSRRITVLCSATMKMNVQRLGEISLKDAVHLKADPADEGPYIEGAEHGESSFSAPAQLRQAYAMVPAKLRLVTLTAVLKRAFYRHGSVMKAIVFISCADSVDFHFDLFTHTAKTKNKATQSEPEANGEKPKDEASNGTIAFAPTLSTSDNAVNLYKLHGSLAQPVRTSTLSVFTHSKDPCILVCTDVASRGLDLPNVDLVVEYDPPFSRDDHLHRVGRTARAGRDGRALIFLLPGEEEGYVDVLRSGYRDGGKGLVRHDAAELLKKGFGSTGVGAGKDWEERATEWQLDVERRALENPRFLEMARRAFQGHVRAYATHVAAERAIFNIKSLHLGHLAKSYALRDKPGSINVPGLRSGKAAKGDRSTSRRLTLKGDSKKSEDIEYDTPTANVSEASRKMRAKMREHMAGISEFNLG